MVPVVNAEDGKWLISESLLPVGKPGGHGAIWKLASDRGIFEWLYRHGRKGATLRQVRLSELCICFSPLCKELLGRGNNG